MPKYNIKCNVSNNRGKTKTLVLGSIPNVDQIQEHLKKNIPTILKKIIEESIQDLNNFEKKLKEFGISVLRVAPNFIEDTLNVRNYFIVIDQCCYVSKKQKSLEPLLKKINNKIFVPWEGSYCPNIFIDDDYVILDGLEPSVYAFFKEKLKDKRKIITAFNQGHSDGIYTNVKKKLWITNGNVLNFKKYWPTNDVFNLSIDSNNSINRWEDYKEFSSYRNQIQQTKGRYFTYGYDLDETTQSFIEKYMKDWIGYCDETLFDLNFITIDENNVIAIGHHSKVYNTLKEYGITVHPIQFKHRFFWDSGLHCITNEIYRDP